MTLLVRLNNVSKIYPLEGIKIKALQQINLTIRKGEFLAIMGPSGSGKSTLMHILGLLDIPTSGSLLLEGKDVSSLSEIKRARLRNKFIGFVFQQFNLLPRLSALENTLLPLIYNPNFKGDIKKRAAEQLNLVGLANRLNHHPNQLSGGEQQRIAIARALINQPQLLLADEPTGNLDTKTGKQIMQLFSKLHNQGQTIVLVTHEPSIAKFAQRIVRIIDGKLST